MTPGRRRFVLGLLFVGCGLLGLVCAGIIVVGGMTL